MNSFTDILQEFYLDFKQFLAFLFKIFRFSILEKAFQYLFTIQVQVHHVWLVEYDSACVKKLLNDLFKLIHIDSPSAFLNDIS